MTEIAEIEARRAHAEALIATVPVWYHRIEIPPGLVTPGIQDSRELLEQLPLPSDCSGMRALDIGTCDGFFSFELERRGADVLALDYRAAEQTGFAVAHRLLGSAVRHQQANVLELRCDQHGEFDLVLCLGVLYHLRDPLEALGRIWDVTAGTLILESRILDGALLHEDSFHPMEQVAPGLKAANLAQFYPNDEIGGDPTNWWVPSLSCMGALAQAAGFEVDHQAELTRSRGVLRARRVVSAERIYQRRIGRGTVRPSSESVDSDTPAAQDHGREAPARTSSPGLRLRARELPMPPSEMRALVGHAYADEASFDGGRELHGLEGVPAEALSHVLDFGCGCGRLARLFARLERPPATYLGIDLHRGMVEWCQTHLAAELPGFSFAHHDVHNVSVNPGEDKPGTRPLPVDDASCSLVVAVSVFTHLDQQQAEHYLRECARVLQPDGYLQSTWFLFDKAVFPMLQEHTNCLYVSYADPSAAVLSARSWVLETAAEAGLRVSHVVAASNVRGHEWTLTFSPRAAGRPEALFPEDHAPVGLARAPEMPDEASRSGRG